jgi:hypothetical protein
MEEPIKMRKTLTMNKHQKAAHKPGEVQVSRSTVAELIELSCSAEAEDRLHAAKYLCPCHVQGRVDEAWAALYRMMEDADPRVRQQAWHALEDGGVPNDDAALAKLEQLYQNERDAKVRKFAHMLIGKTLAARQQVELTRQTLALRRAPLPRGKCDFCGATDVPVQRDLNTTIPTSGLPRAALICASCAN